MHRILATTVLPVLLLPSCAPIGDPGDFMRQVQSLPTSPPNGKSLVYFHRPREHQGHPLYLGLWDRFEMIADLGNGQTTAYVCNPGRHTFIGRSVEIKTVVEAELLPDKIYDFRSTGGGWWIASFHLIPITKDDEEWRSKIPAWMEEHMFVERLPADDKVREYEADTKPKLETILKEAAEGEVEKIRFGPENHR